MGATAEHAVTLDQLRNAVVDRSPGLEAGFAQALVRDDVIALVGVAADLSEVDVEIGYLALDRQRQLLLRQIGVVQTCVIRAVDHRFGVFDAMDEAVGNVAHMDIVALEVLLEDDDEAVGHGGVGEVVDQQVDAHARRGAEHCRQAQCDHVAALQELVFSLHLLAAVVRNRFKRRLLGAIAVARLGAIAAVGVGIDHQLVRAAQSVDQTHAAQVDAFSGGRVAVAGRRANDRGEWDDDVGVGDEFGHQAFVTRVAAHEVEARRDA